jgi:hypothetical protein
LVGCRKASLNLHFAAELAKGAPGVGRGNPYRPPFLPIAADHLGVYACFALRPKPRDLTLTLLCSGTTAGDLTQRSAPRVGMPSESLVARIRVNTAKCPDCVSRLPRRVACDRSTRQCEAVLLTLIEEGFLVRTTDGAFIALPTMSRALKAGVVRSHLRESA